MTSGSAVKRDQRREQVVAAARQAHEDASRRRRLIRLAASILGVLVVAGVITAGLLSARPTQQVAVRTAPDSTLPGSDNDCVVVMYLHSWIEKNSPLRYYERAANCFPISRKVQAAFTREAQAGRLASNAVISS